MSPLLGHMPSLWITHKENGPLPTTGAQCGLVGANECKFSRLNVPFKHGGARDNKFLVTHPMTDQRCTSAIARWSALTVGPSNSSFIVIIICLISSPLLGHRPSLWIAQYENETIQPSSIITRSKLARAIRVRQVIKSPRAPQITSSYLPVEWTWLIMQIRLEYVRYHRWLIAWLNNSQINHTRTLNFLGYLKFSLCI
jgi:hypothetical protein